MRIRHYKCVIFTCLSVMLLGSACFSDVEVALAKNTELTDYSLEDLMRIKVTSVSKKPEELWKAASAVYVITQEDIRRSGATSIMEAMRCVPGMQVARLNSSTYGISTRGFNEEFASKLLVLVDGVCVYDPIFTGVFWMNQDLMMEDIDRIEVIRGPGASVWGANAVNGIINIITKNADSTQGFLASETAGTEERSLTRLRYGGQSGNTNYRVYGLYSDHDGQVNALGQDAGDDWQSWRAGFRTDTAKSPQDTTTVIGNVYGVQARQMVNFRSLSPPALLRVPDEPMINVANLLVKREFTDDRGADNTFQFYWMNSDHDSSAAGRERANTWDFDFQRHSPSSGLHDVLWGLGCRFISDRSVGVNLYTADPISKSTHLLSAFVQDEITLSPDNLHLILGTKIEHNSYTGVEIQPNGRIVWTPDPRHTAWASVSRAVRTPSRRDTTIDLNGNVSAAAAGGLLPEGTPILTVLQGNPNLDSEDLVAYEIGYRTQPRENLSFDVATFYNSYKHLITLGPGGDPFMVDSPAPAHLVVPMRWVNGQHGSSYGVEVASNWQASDKWRLKLGYSTLKMKVISDAASHTFTGNGANPGHQAFLQSSLDIGRSIELDNIVTQVGSINNTKTGAIIPGYTRVDLVLGWRRSPTNSISLVLQNLTSSRHAEMFSVWSAPSEVERSGYLKCTWSL